VRVLIVHHGRRPEPGQPVTGGARRAHHLGAGLAAAGHDLVWLQREQDGTAGFASPEDLFAKARALGPDRIITVQLEDAPPLAAVGVPLAVDLYAPRLLEAPFEGSLRWTSVETLRALGVGDTFLVSNPRQRWFWMGVLALAGVDVTQDPTLLVPLVAPIGPRRRLPSKPVFVAGGASWPWQDPSEALNRVLAFLDARGTGTVVWYGGPPPNIQDSWRLPEHPRLSAPGWVPEDTLRQAYATATAALDWMAPNPERALAFSFRHADYLGCGLPILTQPDTALADVLGDAGWIDTQVEDVLDQVLRQPDEVRRRGKAARALAKARFSVARCTAPLVAWVESGDRTRRHPTDLVDHARLAADAAQARAAEVNASRAQAAAEAEVSVKRNEVTGLTDQVQSLTRVVDRLSRAVDEVAGFKREAITLLGNQSDGDRRSLDHANRELALLRADIEKKTAELQAMDDIRDRLEHDIEGLNKEIRRLRQRGIFRRE
jgi:hypothetical protein